MKSTLLPIALGLSLLVFTNCNNSNEPINIDYKYADKPVMVSCKIDDQKLINEALYSFEDDITLAFNKNNRVPERSFQGFISRLMNKSFKIEDVASKHSLALAKALQQSSHYNNNVLDIKGALGNCIFENIKDKNLKTSLNALKDANSLRPNVVLPTFRNYSRNFTIDKNFAALLAFDYYYNQLMLINETDLKTAIDKPQNGKIDFNNVPKQSLKAAPPAGKSIRKTDHKDHNH
jgi:hypothetical protein